MSNPQTPHSSTHTPDPEDPAVNIIRTKIDTLYDREPSAKQEINEVEQAHGHLSKHQKFMAELSTSGKSLAEIQTEWHNYYTKLPDDEKHKVWQEFYEANGQATVASPAAKSEPKPEAPHTPADKRSVAEVKKQIHKRVLQNSKIAKNHHVRSLLFGFSMGGLVLLFLLFGFFNERFITPFITPSRSVSSTPIIIDPKNSSISKDPKIIIPKINVEIPVVYNTPYSNNHDQNEAEIQKNLENGVVHYPATPKPGELGNAAIVGHSSNNIFNQGKYKFAFVLLKRLNEGDTFYIDRGGVRYAYKIYEKKIVDPSDVSVLQGTGKTATVTLITCDPPGTSLRRLVVVGEQVSPSPNKNAKSSATASAQAEGSIVPGNAPTLWHRLTGWLFD
jgi:sortase A